MIDFKFASKREKKFNFLRFRFQYGRYHYDINDYGEIIGMWWEWE